MRLRDRTNAARYAKKICLATIGLQVLFYGPAFLLVAIGVPSAWKVVLGGLLTILVVAMIGSCVAYVVLRRGGCNGGATSPPTDREVAGASNSERDHFEFQRGLQQQLLWERMAIAYGVRRRFE